jgi:ABC transport system ATP-binding/permease protein
MHYASLENVSKGFGVQPLFENITIHINEGDKIALIAKNGNGKSTLLKILCGLEYADNGKVWVHKDVNVVFLTQEPIFDENKTVLENIFDHPNPQLELIKQYEILLQTDPESMELFAISQKIDEEGAWGIENEVHQIISKLKLSFLQQPMKQLSGGQRKRVALAKTLIDVGFQNQHTLLILDEPTNHLDFGMIEWLEHYLNSHSVTLLLVTHDRYFLDGVAKQIIELSDSIIYNYEGNYSYYLEKKAERELVTASELQKDKNIFRRELEWMRKQPKARTVKSKSRIDAFDEVKQRAMKRKDDLQLEFQVKMTRLGGKTVELKKVYKAFGALEILKGFDYTFKKGERVGIVGPNGVGKSTFLNMLQNLEQPDSGKINIGETVVFGNYDQKGLQLKEDKRVIEFVKDIAENFVLANGTKVSPSQFLQKFLFEGDKQHTFISKLSGGEKRRLHLLSVLYQNPNFLILDEPTNDLDLLTLQVLEEFLLDFPGCVVIVSHDRYFLDKLVDHLMVFEGEAVVSDFPGTYTEYREFLKATVKDEDSEDNEVAIKTEPTKVEKPKLSYQEKKEFDKLEKEIEKLENEKKIIEEKLNTTLSFDEVNAASMRLGDILKQLDEKGMRWLELSENV